jgi:hypothetical protein
MTLAIADVLEKVLVGVQTTKFMISKRVRANAMIQIELAVNFHHGIRRFADVRATIQN